MGTLSLKREQYFRRRKRSKKAFPVEGEYRLCVYKSSKHIEAQIIDDELIIQNYGNAMNNYHHIKDCNVKYIHLTKKK